MPHPSAKLTVIRGLTLAAGLTLPALAFAQVQDAQIVPEPETLALIGVAAVAMLVARWKRRK
jgi:hypothetical protein